MEKAYKKILCAVRGQLESRATARKAIGLALEHGASLEYCFIIDVEFLKGAATTLSTIRHVYRQLEEMTEFALAILKDQTIEQGVPDVDYRILKGDIPTMLIEHAQNISADAIVLGFPIKSMGKNVFKPKEFQAFVERIESELGIDVIDVKPESKENLKDFPGTGGSQD